MDLKSLRIAFALLLPLLWVDGVSATPCESTSYDLTSQAAVDALGQTGCTAVFGSLRIQNSTDITNVDKLTGITTVNNLEIEYNDSLTNLDGLINLANVFGDLLIMANTALNDVDGLTNLTRVGGSFYIELNPPLPTSMVYLTSPVSRVNWTSVPTRILSTLTVYRVSRALRTSHSSKTMC